MRLQCGLEKPGEVVEPSYNWTYTEWSHFCSILLAHKMIASELNIPGMEVVNWNTKRVGLELCLHFFIWKMKGFH